MDLNAVNIRPIKRSEFDIAIDWSEAEGWNPSLYDADVFWNTDPDGYLEAVNEDEFVVHAISKKAAESLPGEMEERIAKLFGEIE